MSDRQNLSTPSDGVINVCHLSDPMHEPVRGPLGLTFIDVPAKHLAACCRLHFKSWPEIARFIGNAITDVFDGCVKISDFLPDEDQQSLFFSWSNIAIARKIGEILTELNVAAPEDGASFVLFALSANPRHRTATRDFSMRVHPGAPDYAGIVRSYAKDLGEGLLMTFNISLLVDPGLTFAWLAGISYDPFEAIPDLVLDMPTNAPPSAP